MGCSASSQARTVETRSPPAPAPQTHQGESIDPQTPNVDQAKPGKDEPLQAEDPQADSNQTEEPKPRMYCQLLL